MELEVLSVLDDDEFDVCESISERMLWAVEVSPDCKALSSELSAFSRGFEDEESPVAPVPGGAGGGLAAT